MEKKTNSGREKKRFHGMSNTKLLRTDEVEITIRGIHFKYTEIVAECFSCKEEIYVPYINDYNCDSREHAYVTAKNRKENADGRTD